MAIKFTKSPVYSTGNSIKFSNTGNILNAKMNVYPNAYCPSDKNSAIKVNVSGLLKHGDFITARGEWNVSSPWSNHRGSIAHKEYLANYFLLLGVQDHVDYQLDLTVDPNCIDPYTGAGKPIDGFMYWLNGPCSNEPYVNVQSSDNEISPGVYDPVINYTPSASGNYSIDCTTYLPYINLGGLGGGQNVYSQRVGTFEFKVTCVRSLDWIVDGVTTDVSEAFSMYPNPYILTNSFVPGGINSATISTNKPHRYLYLQSEGGVPENYHTPGNVGTYHDADGSFNIAQYYRNLGFYAPSEETIDIFDVFQEKVVAKLQINGIVPYT